PALGTSFDVVGSSTTSGAFTKLLGAVIAQPKYFRPTYPGAGVTLVVATAALTSSPSGGPGGTSVTLNGSGFPASSTVKITVTSYPSVSTDASGAFSTSITIPAGAAPGTGRIAVTDTLTGVARTRTFSVS